jgi:phosphoserine phosphatase
VKPRPNVLRLMDEARAEGLKVAVASAGTKEAVTLVVETLLGADRYEVCDPAQRPLAH